MRSLIRPSSIIGFFLILFSLFILPSQSFAQLPANDLCANATLLNSGTTCVNVAGTLKGTAPAAPATATAGIAVNCGNAAAMDVWYKFVAETAYPTISLSSIGSNLTTAGPRIQLFSGTCLGLTSLACVTTTSLNVRTVIGGAGLNVGQTYLIRIYSNSNTTLNSNWGFNICITDPAGSGAEYGRSYVNITKGTVGGTIDPGDILEMRTTLVIPNLAVDSIAFADTLYNGRGLALVPGSISLRTNEGKLYKAFGDLFTDNDAGWYYKNGLDTVIRINMGSWGGTHANNFATAKLRNTSRPSVFGNRCILMATYRVRVYAPYNTQINFKTGSLQFRDSATGILTNAQFPDDKFMVYQSPGLCPNATSVSNAIGVESNGTFGSPAVGPINFARNRGTSPYTLYTYSPFVPGFGPQDYFYGITNNTSSEYSVLNTYAKPEADPDGAGPLKPHRVFAYWDIIGDHTGAANPAKGNPPCDTTKPVSATNPCGYMLVINSAYRTDTAFQYTATNLCPSTYYEISAWFRNICYKCACDSLGQTATNASYIPFAQGDSSGVQPNLAFNVDGVDYYTTGNIPYYGTDIVAPRDTTVLGSDSLNRWVKRGFTFVTGPTQNSFNLTIRNNAPGGGGNDWAIDDISISTCLPNMSYSPSLNPVICQGNPAQINDTIRSYFSSFNYYKWQVSTNNGGSWTDVAGSSGSTTPTWNGSAYEYITGYTIPPATSADSGKLYRVVVATAPGNLSLVDCQITDGVSQIRLDVQTCTPYLDAQLLGFNGKLQNKHAMLTWITSKETSPVTFYVEKSTNGINFARIGSREGLYLTSGEMNQYNFTDSVALSTRTYYRIAMLIHASGTTRYSRIIQLNNTDDEVIVSNIVNPFYHRLSFDLTVEEDGKLETALMTTSGLVVKQNTFTVHNGMNNLALTDLEALPSAVYILQIRYKDKTVIKKVMKK